jgi:mannosyltransferase OCH1-like enzyme
MKKQNIIQYYGVKDRFIKMPLHSRMISNRYNTIKIGTLFILICIILAYARMAYIKEPISKELFEIPFHIERKSTTAPRIISGVPLNIYQSWHSNKIPTKMRETIYSLLDMNPEFDYYLYSDDACRNFIKDNFNEDVVAAFDSFKPGAYKSDLWRYCILYKLGGVYLDIKFKSVVPLAPIIEKNPEILVRDLSLSLSFEMNSKVYNGFMVSPPNNPIFKETIEDIVRSSRLKLYKTGYLDITGPGCLLRVIEKNRGYTYIYSVNFYYSYKNIYDFIKSKVIAIYYNNTLIFESYPEYRYEQNLFEKTPHYSKLWLARDVYN